MAALNNWPRLVRQIPKIGHVDVVASSRFARRELHTKYRPRVDGALSEKQRVLRACILGLGATPLLIYGFSNYNLAVLHAESPPAPAEVQIEKRRKTAGLSKEDNRDSISSQHFQVKRSWENPGVYAWGSNSGKVVAPDSDETQIKTPRRIPYFDGLLLRDLKLDQNFGAAITEKGDLLQWGVGFAKDQAQPTPTLVGKNLKSISFSGDRIIALGSNGKVYSLPISQNDQAQGPKRLESTWIPFWTSRSKVSYRTIEPSNLSWNEKVSSISAGLESLLILTSSGRVFSAAASSEEFPSRGEMGIPGLTWSSRPSGPYDQPHEISTLRGFDIAAIASGDYHSLALDKEGRVFSFGDNTSGQLGFDPNLESPYIDAPSLIPISRLYAGTSLSPRVTSIAAGGSNSFFTVDATQVSQRGETGPNRLLGRITADTWACGSGILGTLGTGRWTHIQGSPQKIKPLSGLFEWDEINNLVVPIRLKSLSVGSTHVSATMDNVTHVGTGESKSTDSRNDTNWGADVVWWGGNQNYQLGTGKRNNANTPLYIAPLDYEAELVRAKRKEEHRFQITPRHTVKIGGGRKYHLLSQLPTMMHKAGYELFSPQDVAFLKRNPKFSYAKNHCDIELAPQLGTPRPTTTLVEPMRANTPTSNVWRIALVSRFAKRRQKRRLCDFVLQSSVYRVAASPATAEKVNHGDSIPPMMYQSLAGPILSTLVFSLLSLALPATPAQPFGSILYPDKAYDFAPGDAIQVVWTQSVVNSTFQLWCDVGDGYEGKHDPSPPSPCPESRPRHNIRLTQSARPAVYSTDIINDDQDPYLKFNVFLYTCHGTDCYFAVSSGLRQVPPPEPASAVSNITNGINSGPVPVPVNSTVASAKRARADTTTDDTSSSASDSQDADSNDYAESVHFNITVWDVSGDNLGISGPGGAGRNRPPPGVQWSLAASPPHTSFPEVPGTANDTCGNG
ncbi:uncharacterized protein KY384_005799 [Bacidia gigantensis]|uniref:uncharacterized protein n=1 Tax=Bacidia gigantensis TaxID=2732470 RepID=UPI001D038F82|nr:uncharacterized protein KY384_005799 [Bacidia gigantensis]KAG8529164.1 hypothetical protein KY384_005799 [Bacidia gigantensis]